MTTQCLGVPIDHAGHLDGEILEMGVDPAMPGSNWKFSDETISLLEAIEANARNAVRQGTRILVD